MDQRNVDRSGSVATDMLPDASPDDDTNVGPEAAREDDGCDAARPASVEAARAVGLTYVSDAAPGLRRRKAGKYFTYRDEQGQTVRDAEVLARVRSLAIPPAWTDVWISPDPQGHIQATGRDQRGRKQYRYHPVWTTCRDEAKFSTLSAFAVVLPDLREQVDHDMRRRGLPRERVIATIVQLLDRTMIRIGNDIYRKQNKSFGLTTLRRRHVAVEGATLRFGFLGKSGQEWDLKISDRRIAGVLRTIQELPGQNLFKYIDEDGERRLLHSHDVNAYIHDAAGPIFTSKHFRTWGASVSAASHLSRTLLPDTKREQARVLNEVTDRVAARLRNTRAVCRRCYIHPAIFEAWLAGTLNTDMAALRTRFRRPLKGLDHEESTFARWLRRIEQEQGQRP